MVKSMTGFGRGEAEGQGYKLTVECKSINNRYLEVAPRMPRQLLSLEDGLKKTVGSYAARGRVDVFVTLEETEDKPKTLKTDKELALAYQQGIKEIAALCGIEDKLTPEMLVRLPGVFSMEKSDDDLEVIGSLLNEALAAALTQLVAMRKQEGDKLAADLLMRRDTVLAAVAEIEKRSPLVVEEYSQKLKARIVELLDSDKPFDEGRFATEVAYFADRSSITEELIRLDSHLGQLKELLNSDESVGRKLDFLMQELNREINTVGSKANDLAINKLVIDVKSELEKIREQVQNIE